MENLERQLFKAVQAENIELVKQLLLKGADVNKYSSGLTPLGVAAKTGNVPLLEALLGLNETDRQNDDPSSKKKSFDKISPEGESNTKTKRKKGVEGRGNNGYYVMVHDDEPGNGEPDHNRNNGENLDDVNTPEGMEKLEWDVEVDVEEEPSDDDIWSNQYRWYADILEKTSETMHGENTGEAEMCQKKSDVNMQDLFGRSPLHYASEQGHVNAVKLLISAGSRPEVGDVDCVTPLHLAASRGHTQVCQMLLQAGARVDSKTTDKMSALHYAASRDYPDTVKLLLDHRANINCLDSTDRTPLKLAASRNLVDIVILLVNRGAKINLEDNKGYSTLCEAVWQKSVVMAKVLLEAGAKMKPSDFLVHYAVLHRQEPMVHLLVSYGALLNLRDNLGQTPLITAALTNQLSLVEFLLDNGAKVDFYWEVTPLSVYVSCNRDCSNLEMIKLLVSRGADLERSTFYNAPLAHAIVIGKLKVAAMLVALGANVNMRFTHPSYGGADCMTLAFHHAKHLPLYQELVKMIIQAGYDMRSLNNIPYMNDTVTDPILKWLQMKKSNPLQLAELCRIALRHVPRGQNRGATLLTQVASLGLPPLIQKYVLMFDEPILVQDQRLVLSVQMSESSRNDSEHPLPWLANYLPQINSP